MKINNEADAMAAMQRLHDMGPSTVVLSSTSLGTDGVLVGLASYRKGGCQLNVQLTGVKSTCQKHCGH